MRLKLVVTIDEPISLRQYFPKGREQRGNSIRNTFERINVSQLTLTRSEPAPKIGCTNQICVEHIRATMSVRSKNQLKRHSEAFWRRTMID